MELKQMRYFLAVAQERNFSRAAERLNMAQPPLTRQIHSLEVSFGTPLFVRTAKGVDLTDAGQSLFEEVPNILALAERAEKRTRLNGQGRLGRLDVGSFGSGMLKMVPRVLAAFHERRPDVEISLQHLDKSEQIKALRDRRIGVGFACLVPRESDLRVEQKVEDSVTAIALVSSGYGLCITTDSAGNLRLPGVVYRPFRSPHLRDLELSCFYRRGDDSPVLKEFLDIARQFASNHIEKTR